MIIKDILRKAIEIICDDEIDLDSLSKKRDKILSCGQMILSELTEEFVHLRECEKMSVTDGRIYYTEFDKNVKDIIGIYKNGVKVDFAIYPLYVECDATGIVEVKYVYHLDEIDMDSEINLPPMYTKNLIAIGIASEYFYRSGLIDEGIFYKNRYDNALTNISRKRSRINVKVRC